MLFQNPDDLLFREPISFHGLPPWLRNRLTQKLGHLRGAVYAFMLGIAVVNIVNFPRITDQANAKKYGRSDMKMFLISAALLIAVSGNAMAGAAATGDQINAAISGNTVQGSMFASGAYTEFYGADGVIKGKDYTGRWRVYGDTMCFQYGQDPEACWQVKLDGDQVTWVKDGKNDGTGTIVKGNPNNF